MRRAAGTARFAWNSALADHRAMSDATRAEPDEARRKGLWPTTAKLRAHWAERRRAELRWSYEVIKCAGTKAVMDLGGAFDRFGKELRDARREGRKPHRQFGAPRFKSRRRATPAFALWNDQFAVTNHFRFDAYPRATMRVPLLGDVRLREAVPGIGSIFGCRVSERRGRWYASFQFDTDWNDGERSDKAETIARAKARKAAAAVTEDGADLGAEGDGCVRPGSARSSRARAAAPPAVRHGRGGGRRHRRRRRGEHRRGRAHSPCWPASRTPGLARSGAAADRAAAAPPGTLGREGQARRRRRVPNRAGAAEQGRRAPHEGALPPSGRSGARGRCRAWCGARRTGATTCLHKALGRGGARGRGGRHGDAAPGRACCGTTASRAACRRRRSGRLVGMVRYKAEKPGAGIALGAPRFFPSSASAARAARAVNAGLALGERSWSCPTCGAALGPGRQRRGQPAPARAGGGGGRPRAGRRSGPGSGWIAWTRARLRGGLARGPRAVRRRR